MKGRKFRLIWIVPCIALIIMTMPFLVQKMQRDGYVVVTINAKVKTYDQFQLYFQDSDEGIYSDDNSILRTVIGMENEQNISFYLPDSINIENLRLDIGRVPANEIVTINTIQISTSHNSITISPSELIPNSFVKQVVDGKFYLQVIDGKFNPSIEFSKMAIELMTDLREQRPISWPYASIVTVLVFLLLWYWDYLVSLNKFSPYYVIAGLLLFPYLGRQLEKILKQDKVIISLEAVVKKNDVFDLYILPPGASTFSPRYSVQRKIYGSDVAQRISFVIPDTVSINKVRIDLGETLDQSPIELMSLSIKREDELRLIGEDVFSFFSLNDFVSRSNGSTTLNTFKREDSYAVYDPFIVSTDLIDYMKDLRNSNSSTLFPYIISFLFVLVILTHLVLNTSDRFSSRSVIEYGFLIFFLVLLLLPTADQYFNFKINQVSSEKRELNSKPVFQFAEIGTYPKAFENYYNDNFGFRNVLIRFGGGFKTNIFGASPAPDRAMFGRNNWIFLNGESFGISQDLKRENLLSKKELEVIKNRWISIRDSLSARDINLYKAVWTDKHNIYTEYLPLSMKLQIGDSISRTDQLIEAFQNVDFQIINVRDDLEKAKNDVQVFMKNDTHWNEHGAFIGYKALIKQIGNDFKEIRPFSISDFDITWSKDDKGDLLDIMGLNNSTTFTDTLPNFVFKIDSTEIVSMENHSYPAQTVYHKNLNAQTKLKVLVFRDSFTRNLVKFISPHFAETLYIWKPYDQSIVDSYKPDIVIDCFVERYFE